MGRPDLTLGNGSPLEMAKTPWRAKLAGRLRAISQKAGTDRTVRRALLGKIWSVFAGPIGVLMVARYLTKVEQGFLFTFASIQGIQVFFELGLTFLIMQFASHEKGHLEWTEHGTLQGSSQAKQRLASLLRLSCAWYGSISFMLAIALPLAGIWFFRSAPTGVQWFFPWLLVSASTSISLLLVPASGILEGCGKLADVYGNVLFQTIFSTLAYWLALASGAALYAPFIQWFVATGIAVTWMFISFKSFFLDLWRQPVDAENRISWKRELWPLQWKVALSWASGYFLFQLATPLIFKSLGPVVAGQFGMTQRIVTTIQTVAHTWISTKAALYGTMRAKNKGAQIHHVFWRSLLMSFGIATFFCTLFVIALWALPMLGFFQLAGRFLPFHLSLLMILNILLYIPVFAIAVLVRSAKKEPFVWYSVACAIVASTLYLFWAPSLGAAGFLSTNLLVTALISLPCAIHIYSTNKADLRAYTAVPAR